MWWLLNRYDRCDCFFSIFFAGCRIGFTKVPLLGSGTIGTHPWSRRFDWGFGRIDGQACCRSEGQRRITSWVRWHLGCHRFIACNHNYRLSWDGSRMDMNPAGSVSRHDASLLPSPTWLPSPMERNFACLKQR